MTKIEKKKKAGEPVKMYPLISVVVPVYKVEEYLPKCVETLKAQDYPNLEILLVDDGSPDQCGMMCDIYARESEVGLKDGNNVHKIIALHKENGGLSDARNFGVAHASGEYVVFVDSDDYVSEDYVSYLFGLMRRHGADLAFAVTTKGTGDDHEFDPSIHKEYGYTEDEAMMRMMYGWRAGVSAYAKIYPIELVKKYPFPKGRLYEDLAVMYKIFGDCENIAYGDKDIYLYRQREGAITRQTITKKHLYGVKAAQDQIDYCEEYYPTVVPAAIFRYAFKIMQYIPALLDGSKESRRIFRYLQIKMKKYAKDLIKDPYVGAGAKMKCLAICAGYEPTKALWMAQMKIGGKVF